MSSIQHLTRDATGDTLTLESEVAMASQDIRKARAEYLAALQTRKKELSDELRGIEQQIRVLSVPVPTRARGPRGETSIKEKIATLLAARSEPMYAADIVDELLGQGVTLSVKDPRAVVVTAARRLIKEGRAKQTGPSTFAAA